MLYDRNKKPQHGDGVMALGRIIGFVFLFCVFISQCR